MAGDSQAGDAERPRPRYGELAPEGWSWTPPQTDAERAAAAAPPPAPQTPVGGTLWIGGAAGAPASGARTAAPAWDRTVTIVLLVVGIIGTFFTVGILAALPDAVQMLYTQEDLGTYTAPPSVAGLVVAGGITEAATWLAAAIVSVLLLVRRKRAFYVPLIGAVVSFVVLFIFMSVVLTTDPTLLNYFGRE
jgi:hypothetical protein